jgi:polo-like kinase 1
MSSKSKDEHKLPADGIIRDPIKKRQYRKGKLLGRGGFAKVYELTCVNSGKTYAGKIVPKTLLRNGHLKQKMQLEISIHKSLHHEHIVQFVSNFEDEHHVYMILELCRMRTLAEMVNRRGTVSEPEARYFMHQICLSLQYLHQKHVIHRDLKLGNLLLNENLEIKVGDFGLAAKISCPGDRKMSICGTPNYLAPEVLKQKGHSYEVDIWALGCILYRLLVGCAPFQHEDQREMYAMIKKTKYVIPEKLVKNCPSAVDLITKMLRADPKTRPTIAEILQSQFLNEYRPSSIPSSCLTMAPRFDTVAEMNLTARSHSNAPLPPARIAGDLMKENESAGRVVNSARPMEPKDGSCMPTAVVKSSEGVSVPTELLQMLQGQLQVLFNATPKVPFGCDSPYFENAKTPSSAPLLWISRWHYKSEHDALAYQLSDDSFGVLFNDKTRLILFPNGIGLHYVLPDMSEQYYTIEQHPASLSKKVKLLYRFKDSMNHERLVKAGAKHAKSDGDSLARYPYMLQFHPIPQCILMHLSNGTTQINYFEDHVKIILCPLMRAVTFLHGGDVFRTYSFAGIAENGCSADMYNRLKDAYHLTHKLITSGNKPSPAEGGSFVAGRAVVGMRI